MSRRAAVSSIPPKHHRPRACSDKSNKENIFDWLEEANGRYPFATQDKCKKVRGSISSYIRCNGGYRNVVRRVVKDAMEYHDRNHMETCHLNKAVIRDADLACVSSNVLVIAASCCQKYYLQDKGLIKELLLKLFYCEGNLDRFMTFLDPLVFPFEVDGILYTIDRYAYLGTITSAHLRVLEYYLRFGADIDINIQYSEFQLNSASVRNPCTTYKTRIPLVDVPIASCRGSTPLLLACQSINSEAVLLLLRYGADPLRVGAVHQIVGLQFQHPLYVISTKLNASVFWRTHNRHLNPVIRSQFMVKQLAQDAELQLILGYFYRALPSLPLAITNHVSGDGRFAAADREAFTLHEYYKDLVPAERIETAAELAHLCRCQVREVLKQNKQLPDGIRQLPLPSLLLDYLDLLLD